MHPNKRQAGVLGQGRLFTTPFCREHRLLKQAGLPDRALKTQPRSPEACLDRINCHPLQLCLSQRAWLSIIQPSLKGIRGGMVYSSLRRLTAQKSGFAFRARVFVH